MRLVAPLIRLSVLLLVAVICVPGRAAPPASIRVVLDDSYPPYIFRDSSGKVQGILKDLWSLWQQRTGIAVDFQPMDWAKARAVMESGHADVIDTIFETAERRATYDFSAPYATIEVPIFFQRNIGGITDAASLKGFTIGVKDGDACIDYLRSKGINELRRYPSYEAEVKAAVRQEIRILCIDKPPAYYYFNREGAADDFRHSPPLYVGQFHWAVAKGRSDLKKLVEDGFSRITPDEKAAIETRWLGESLGGALWPGVTRYGGYALSAVALLLATLFAWNRALRGRVIARTHELSVSVHSLRESEIRFHNLFEQANDAIFIMRGATVLECNRRAEIMYGLSRADIVGASLMSASPQLQPDGRASEELLLKMVAEAEAGHAVVFEWRNLRPDGSPLDVEVSLSRVDFGGEACLQAIVRDITERKQAEQAKRSSEDQLRAFYELDLVGLAITSPEKGWLRINGCLCKMLGYSESELRNMTWAQITHPDDLAADSAQFTRLLANEIDGYSLEKRFISATGAIVPTRLVVRCVRKTDGSVDFVTAMVEDITERKTAEDKIQRLAFTDPLTALPNRRLLHDRLGQALAASARNDRLGALMFLDLDNFKTLNDTQGHETGDMLLQQVAQRLSTCVRGGDTLARFGGDEFVVMLEDLSENAEEAARQTEAVGEKILATLDQPYLIGRHASHSTASIGATLFKGHRNSIEELLRQADLAMYQAKTAGRNTLRFFDPQMQAIVTNRAALEVDLREAVRQQQFVLFYQAQLSAGRLTGAEALIRWNHPVHGLIAPAVFIPLAEETGLILPLGNWVLETACAQLAKWAGHPSMAHLTLAVNVSAKQLHKDDFVEQVMAVLDDTGANPHRLKLELTESLLVSNVESTITKMAALKAQGVGFSLDDFGTGYSSLSYLKRLPLEQLKIDMGFVRDILTDPNDAAIARMVIVLAESSGLSTIAEGVESEAQRDFLASLGCDAYQGHFFSRPIPLESFEEFAQKVGPVLLPGVSE